VDAVIRRYESDMDSAEVARRAVAEFRADAQRAAWVQESIPELGSIQPQVNAGPTTGVMVNVPA
jgi:hypothetical protein